MKEEVLIKKAHALAKKSHKGQKRADGTAFINHPLEVGNLLKKWKQDSEVICAGLLHDVIEDASISLGYIKRHFGKRTAELVDGASWIRKKVNGKWKKDWHATYKKFLQCAKKDSAMVLLKAADMISNRPMAKVHSLKEFIERKSGPRNRSFWFPFFRAVGLRKLANKLDKDLSHLRIKREKVVLFDYISKKDLRGIKKKLPKIESLM